MDIPMALPRGGHLKPACSECRSQESEYRSQNTTTQTSRQLTTHDSRLLTTHQTLGPADTSSLLAVLWNTLKLSQNISASFFDFSS